MVVKQPSTEMQHRLLDLLVDGPSSFAALFGSLRDHYGYVATGATVEAVIDALCEMAKRSWVTPTTMSPTGTFRRTTEEDICTSRKRYREWLPNAARGELSVDEIGLWYEISDAGRSEWTRWSQEAGNKDEARWTLDDDSVSRIITIRSANISEAEDALSTWVAQSPKIELMQETKETSPLSRFKLRDGTEVTDGVILTCAYRLRET